VVLPIQSGAAPFWAGEFGPARLGQQSPSVLITPEHEESVVPLSVVVVTVSTGNVVVVVVAPRTVVLTRMVVTVTNEVVVVV